MITNDLSSDIWKMATKIILRVLCDSVVNNILRVLRDHLRALRDEIF
jgi:hypothetical protein